MLQVQLCDCVSETMCNFLALSLGVWHVVGLT